MLHLASTAHRLLASRPDLTDDMVRGIAELVAVQLTAHGVDHAELVAELTETFILIRDGAL